MNIMPRHMTSFLHIIHLKAPENSIMNQGVNNKWVLAYSINIIFTFYWTAPYLDDS